MRKKQILVLTGLLLLLTGCSSAPQTTKNGQKWQDDWTKIGTNIGINVPEQFTLFDNKDVLAADGLYYATWVTGNAIPFENSDGDTIDLYDAQLYFLASEAPNEKAATDSCNTWLAAAKENYEIQTEDTIVCNGQSYILLTYRCVGEDNPYDRGASAFGACGVNAVCVEFTCLENYKEDFTSLLTELLNNCHYRAD